MCGIAGVWDPNGRISAPADELPRAVASMARAIAHRGPDDGGQWASDRDRLVLAHRRLSIVDLSPTGKQPMQSQDRGFCIAFNGEIYNHRELRASLAAAGVAFRGSSDTEVLLESIARRGLNATLKGAFGMFAFVLWDARDRILTLCRDRLGEKPLYYSIAGGVLHFGSELGAVCASPWLNASLDSEAARDVLAYGYVRYPRSIMREVAQLPPGCVLELDADRLVRWRDVPRLPGVTGPLAPALRRYWSLLAQTAAPQDLPDEQAAQSTLKDALAVVIAEQVEADVPVGAFLSGGIDSTLVTAMASRIKTGIKTFTIGFADASYDESGFAAKVAAYLGTEHICRQVSEHDLLAALEDNFLRCDEPFGNPSQLPLMLLSNLARQHVKVVLGGDGGDEFFLGYNRYRGLSSIARARSLLPAPIRRALARGSGGHMSTTLDGAYRGVASVFPRLVPRIQDPGTKVAKYFSAMAELDSADVYEGFIRTDLPDAVFDLDVAAGWQWGEVVAALPDESDVRRCATYDQLAYLVDDNLTKVDRATMREGLECRAPLLDWRVAGLAARMPERVLTDRGRSKAPLRKLLDEFVPRDLLDRPKMGFSVPVARWLRGPLAGTLRDALAHPAWNDVEGVNVPVLRESAEMHIAGNGNFGRGLWAALVLGLWLAQNQPSQQ